MGLGIGCGVGWGPGFGPEVIGYVGAGCGVGFSVGFTFAGVGIGLPANYIFQAPYNAVRATTQSSNGFFLLRDAVGDGWNSTVAPCLAGLQRGASVTLGSFGKKFQMDKLSRSVSGARGKGKVTHNAWILSLMFVVILRFEGVCMQVQRVKAYWVDVKRTYSLCGRLPIAVVSYLYQLVWDSHIEEVYTTSFVAEIIEEPPKLPSRSS